MLIRISVCCVGIMIVIIAGAMRPGPIIIDFTDAGVSNLINSANEKLGDGAVFAACVQGPLTSAITNATFDLRTPKPDQMSAERCGDDAQMAVWSFTDRQRTVWGSTDSTIRAKFVAAVVTCRTRYLASGGRIKAQVVGLAGSNELADDGYADVVVSEPTPERPNIMTVICVP